MKTYQVAQKCPIEQNAISRQPIDIFLAKLQNLLRKEFSNVSEDFTEILSLRITPFTILYSVFQNYAEGMNSHL